MTPKVSVVMAVHNGEKYLTAAIASILTQDFADFEFIIVDDGSTDDTAQILAEVAAQDDRIRVLTNSQNIGLTKSLNRGLQSALGEYVARQDADDLSLPNRLVEQAEYLDSNPDAVLVTGNLEIIDAEGNSVGVQHRALVREVVNFRMLFYNHVGGHGQVMFRRQVALEVGGYDESRRYSQDYDLWLRMMALGDIFILPRVWLQWRRHDEGISSAKFDEQEQISLALSQAALTRLTGSDFSLETVARLRQFWLEPFPASEYAPSVSEALRGVLRMVVPPIYKDIAAQFSKWARSISIRRHPRAKLHVMWLALRWRLRSMGHA
jgi:glycosyltransferase involved in cell wall biosynthesis